jgi:hypothetical protein
MGFIRPCGRSSGQRRRSSGQTIAVCAAALLLCLIGLDGCGSSSSAPGAGGASGGSVASGGASPSSTCSTSGFVQRSHRSPPSRRPVLVSAESAIYDIPAPSVDLRDYGDPDDSLQDANDLAGDGNSALHSADNDPFQSPVSDDQENIKQEATGVGLTEEVNLLTDEGQSGLDASDFGQEVCNAISSVAPVLKTLDNLETLYQDLDMGTTGSTDVIAVVKDGVLQFTQAFGSCFDTLSAAETIVEDLEDLFC